MNHYWHLLLEELLEKKRSENLENNRNVIRISPPRDYLPPQEEIVEQKEPTRVIIIDI